MDLDEPGSYLIVGRNGVGKSLLGEAITYALYGWPYRKIKKTQLVNSINKKDMLVVLDFIANGKVYKIRRGMKPTIFEVFCNGKLINQDAENKDYQKELEEKILRMNYESFKQIVLLSKTSYKPFMELKANERRDVIEKLLDIQVFTGMATVLKKRREEASKELDRVETIILTTTDTVKRIRANVARFVQNTEELVSSKQLHIKTLMSEASSANDKLKVIREQIESIQETYEGATRTTRLKRDKAVQLRSKVTDRHRSITRELEFFEHTNNCPTCDQKIDSKYRDDSIQGRRDTLVDLEGALEQLDQRLQLIVADEQKASVLGSELSKLQTTSIELRSTIRHTKTTVESLVRELDQLKSQQSQYSEHEGEITELENVLRDKIKGKKKLLKQLDLYKVGTLLLKDSGIKAQIIKQYVPVINKFIAKYLASMDFFVQFELDENFEEIIKSRFRDEFSYHSFSEGEKFRIDLALLLTWRAIARLRNSCTTNLLFLDEIFDSSLDTTGTDELLKILDTLSAEGTTIMVISHKGDQLADKFENVIRFDKVKNFTTLVET